MKKTPRDLLLSRHVAKIPLLDRLRLAALADATHIPARQLLQALFYPQRRLWLALAAAWIVIFALHFNFRPETHTTHAADRLYVSNWPTNQAQLHALLTETRSSH